MIAPLQTKSAIGAGDATLEVQYKTEDAVTLIELADALHGINSLYDRYVATMVYTDSRKRDFKYQLRVRRVREGSSIFELFSEIIAPTLPLLTSVKPNDLLSFAKYLKTVMDHFLRKETPLPNNFTAQDFTAARNVIAPVSSNGRDQIVIVNIMDGDRQPIIDLNGDASRKVRDSLDNEIKSLKQRSGSMHNRVLLHWDRLTRDGRGAYDHKGIIESISDKAKRVTFVSDGLRDSIVESEDNFFHFMYLVDVEVMTVGGVPQMYKILRIHEQHPIEGLDDE